MNRFTLSITKLYLRSINAKFKEIAQVTLPNGIEIKVIAYSSDNDYGLGQATITRAIIIRDICFKTPDLLNYVVAHEYGHYKSWFSYIAALLITFILLYGFFTLLLGILMLQLGMLMYGLISIVVGCLCSWAIEYKADSTAIRILGMEKVVSARKQIEDLPKPPLLWLIIARMTHPRFSWTKFAYEYFHRHD